MSEQTRKPKLQEVRARRERERRQREHMRSRGLRQIRMWVVDTRAPGFADEARRQSRIIAASEEQSAWLDGWLENQDTTGWV